MEPPRSLAGGEAAGRRRRSRLSGGGGGGGDGGCGGVGGESACGGLVGVVLSPSGKRGSGGASSLSDSSVHMYTLTMTELVLPS